MSLLSRKTHRLPAVPVYLAASGGISFFTTLIFTLNLVYHVKMVGLNPLQLVLVGTVLELSAFLFEIPTGVVADVYSRRLSTIIGFLVMGSGFLIEGLFPVFYALLIAQVVWGLGYTFISGAFDAWITDEAGSDAVGEIFIRGKQIQLVLNFIAIPLSIVLGNIQLNFPIIAGGIFLILMGIWLIFVMPEEHFIPVSKEDREGLSSVWSSIQQGIRSIQGNRAIHQYMGVMVFVGLASEAYDRLNTAHLLTSFQFPQPFSFSISDETWFGILGFIATAVTLILSEQVRKKLDLTHSRKVIGLLILIYCVIAISILTFAITHQIGIAIAAFLMISVMRSITSPIENAWINQHIESRYRATTLSLSSQLNALGQIAGGPILGWVGKRFSILLALVFSGIIHFGPVHFFRQSYQDAVLQESKEPFESNQKDIAGN